MATRVARRRGPPCAGSNFNTQAVIVAYQGQSPTSAGIAVESIRREGQLITVRTKEQTASRAVPTTDLSSSFVAVSFPRPPEGVSLTLDNDEDVIKAEQNRYAKRRSYGRRGRYRRP